jgi:hypothetical protein
LVSNHESRPFGVASARADQERGDGLHYLTLADSAWTSIVTRLADAATLILIAAGEAGPGLRFELEMLDQIAAHNRTVVVLAEVEHDELLPRLLGAELAAEHHRRLAEREPLLSSSLFQRFYRRITLAELDAFPLDAAALAEQAPFHGLLPLTERSQPNTPVRDEATERRIAEAERELQELSAAGSDGGDPLRPLGADVAARGGLQRAAPLHDGGTVDAAGDRSGAGAGFRARLCGGPGGCDAAVARWPDRLAHQ